MRKKKATHIFIMIFLAGLSLLLYPTVSSSWNAIHASEAVTSYREEADALSENQYDELFSAAQSYNSALAEKEQSYGLSEEQQKVYEGLLNLNGSGIMGYIEIPSIDVELPIYHGTDESVLQRSVGHLDWTSLPVGGENTHCVLSGHRALPSAKLFTDLNKLNIGDLFMITVLNRKITYEVDRIETVEPDDVESLEIQEGEDLCTLFTCTPYGINTHRLLVRGHRVPNGKESAHITSEAEQIRPVMVMPFITLPFLLIVFAVMRWIDRRKEWDEGAFTDEKVS